MICWALVFSLAEEFDLRDLGLLYYVMASSDTLGDALKRAARYSRITNEAIVLQYQESWLSPPSHFQVNDISQPSHP